MRQDMETRFWSKVDRQSAKECWFWLAGKDSWGYGTFSIGQHKKRMAHRMAWSFLVGEIPDGQQLDHICRHPACVNPAHLRYCDNTQNAQNTGAKISSSTGLKGITYCRLTNKWRARIRVYGKRICLGRFEIKEQAAEAYRNAAIELHGEFVNMY